MVQIIYTIYVNIQIFFFREMFLSCLKINEQTPQSKRQTINEHIWHNHKFKVGNKSIFFKVMFIQDLFFIADLFNKY